MADESQSRCFQSLDRDHEDSPSGGIENSPSRYIIEAHGDNTGSQPKIDRVSQCRFSEGPYSGPKQDFKGLQTRRSALIAFVLSPKLGCDIDEVDEP